MASFYAELHVDGRVYPLLSCTYSMHQTTDGRGRVVTKTYDSPVALSMHVPRDSFLAAWAADPYKRCAADLVFRDANGGQALETLHLAGAYCVRYGTYFREGSYLGESQRTLSSYVTQLTLTDPDGYHWQPGGPGAYQAPAARAHGVPITPASVVASPPGSGIISDCTESVRQNLQNQVKQNCKSGKQSCAITDNCPELEQTIETLNACIAARTKINMKCFKGGDAGHQEQILSKINGLVRCQGYYSSKCNKNPQPVFEPRKVPRETPTNLPAIPKEAPLTILGVGAFILYLLSGALRPGPI